MASALSEHFFLQRIWTKQAQQWIAALCCIALFAGFVASRALVSIGMIVMVANALHPAVLKDAWAGWRRNVYGLFCLLFCCTYLISGLWSSNHADWENFTTMKLPFALLPFAFASVPFHKRKFLLMICISIGAILGIAVLYSIGSFLLNSDQYIDGYAVSHTIPTTIYGDHIRFSQSLALYVLICFYFLFEKNSYVLSRGLRVLFAVFALLFSGYLHLLAAKTGLLCLYIVGGVYALVKLYRIRKLYAAGLLVALPLFFYLAYLTVPTFQKKINYVGEEIALVQQGKGDYNYSDIGRIISYRVCATNIAESPVWGVGAGDVRDVMAEGYRKHFPTVPEENMLIPHNQYLFTILAVGILLSSALVAMTLSPLFIRVRNSRVFLMITTLCMLSALMVEASLEIQFGVLIYLFFTLFWLNIGEAEVEKP